MLRDKNAQRWLMKSEMGEEMRRNYNELNLGMKRVAK